MTDDELYAAIMAILANPTWSDHGQNHAVDAFRILSTVAGLYQTDGDFDRELRLRRIATDGLYAASA